MGSLSNIQCVGGRLGRGFTYDKNNELNFLKIFDFSNKYKKN